MVCRLAVPASGTVNRINREKSNQSKKMPRVAFKMQLHPGREAEYKRRHDALWPELETLLKETGISEYSIFLDPETHALFGVLSIEDPLRLEELPRHPVMQRWWAYMADIMASNSDHSPLSVPLGEVFYLK
jgi:L-rhamnose mutarotase